MIKIIQANGYLENQFIVQMKQRGLEENEKVVKEVSAILENVKAEGDQALLRYSLEFDKCRPESFLVSEEEIDRSYRRCDPALKTALETCASKIRAFHMRQKQQSFLTTEENGVLVGQQVRGLRRVGLYVPGGTAAYPSSVLMNAIPAKIAGVRELVMVTPPGGEAGIPDSILAAAKIAGVDTIYRVGGAQAIAALAFGTATIPEVDKIVGPGNIYVATAKRLVFGTVDIDMIAGPSEILILADETANAKYVAADLMSQAEHDKLASSVLVTMSRRLADEVNLELKRQVAGLSRKEMIQKSLADCGAVIVTENLDQAVALSNKIAPEHLEVLTENPISLLHALQNAGSVFFGPYSPEPLGDYFAGPNHVLPTGGTARFFSPLSVDSFMKRTSFISYTKEALRNAGDVIMTVAAAEKLTAHANSIKVRFDDEK